METIKVRMVKHTKLNIHDYRQTYDGYMCQYYWDIHTKVYVSSKDISYNEARLLASQEYSNQKWSDGYDYIPDEDHLPDEEVFVSLSKANELNLHNFVNADKNDETPYSASAIVESLTTAPYSYYYDAELDQLRSELVEKIKALDEEYEKKKIELEEEYDKKIMPIIKAGKTLNKIYWEDKFRKGNLLYNQVNQPIGDPIRWAVENYSSFVFLNCIKNPDFKVSRLNCFAKSETNEMRQKFREFLHEIQDLTVIDSINRKLRACFNEEPENPLQIWKIEIWWRGIVLSAIGRYEDSLIKYASLLAKENEVISPSYIGDKQKNYHYVDLVTLIYNTRITRFDSFDRTILNFEISYFEDIKLIRKFLYENIVKRIKRCVYATYHEKKERIEWEYLGEDWEGSTIDNILEKKYRERDRQALNKKHEEIIDWCSDDIPF